MTAARARSDASLEERWTAPAGWFYMTGMQALVRLPIQQRLNDMAAGLMTGGYISGYRGSPMGRYDIELWRAEAILKRLNVVFRPGLNEDLAATAVWGAQQVGNFPGATVEGVFGIWYGKGPGVDRSGDAFRHANFAGTSPKGGALALAGDDHGAKSSTAVNFSDTSFVAVGVPVLYPSNTQELIDFGLHGIAMSRFSGLWVAMKVVTDVAESGGTVHVGPGEPAIVLPERPTSPPGGLSARAIDAPLAQEERLYAHKLPAALAYARANGLNRIVRDPAGAKVGVVGAGKAWQDLMQALASLEIGRAPPLRLLKVGMVWPLDPVVVREFANGLDLIVVVEEKRPLIEDQIRTILYGTANAPRLVGKYFDGAVFDPEHGATAIPNFGETSPEMIADTLARASGEPDPNPDVSRADKASGAPAKRFGNRLAPARNPGFCAGCPHNRSTRLPDGSRALAGIGCHTMAMYADPTRTTTVSHMGGEGAMWLGQQPFTKEGHVFANLGDGTYAHSGLLAIRQAVAANVPITYKILFNGFVSMTGGQPVEGGMTPPQILAELAAEGVKKLALVADDPDRYLGVALPPGVALRPREALDETQREFRAYEGVSVILYDQPCATERRRLRKRGKWADPMVRTYIHSEVCEGCGDCGRVSNCMAIEPLETEWGRKRRINQSSCNKDFTCAEGFCPSFVTLRGGEARALRRAPIDLPPVPEPVLPTIGERWSVLVAGIGGSGVVTVSQTLAVAAYLDGLFSSNLDLTGLSQKYGAVTGHVRIAAKPEALHATRIGAGEADALIGCDLIVAAGDGCLATLAPRTRAVIDADLIPTSEFARNPDWSVDREAMIDRIASALGGGDLDERPLVFDAQRLARSLTGDAIAANLFMLGAAWQRGLVPVSRAAIERAIELNGVAVEANTLAFAWGRRAAHDLAGVEALIAGGDPKPEPLPTLDALIERREAHLNEAYGARPARRYRALIDKVRAAEQALDLGEALTTAVVRSYHKLIALKDEYEVSRLLCSREFQETLAREFDGEYRVHYHIGSWPFGRVDPRTGVMRKGDVGPWAIWAFRLLARLRALRGTWLDPFRSSDERKLERRLKAEFEADVETALARLNPANHAAAVRLLSLPETIRGYGRVKEASAAEAAKARAAALKAFETPKAAMEMAA